MLRVAIPLDLDFIRRALSEGAAEGSFDPELAASTPASALFFANLRNALGCGFLRAPDAGGTPTREVHVAGYMYSAHQGPPAIGFGLFKELGAGSFELWLTGIAGEARLPEGISEHNDLRLSRLVFAALKRAPQMRLHTERVKEGRRDSVAGITFRRPLSGQDVVAVAYDDDLLQALGLRTPFDHIAR